MAEVQARWNDTIAIRTALPVPRATSAPPGQFDATDAVETGGLRPDSADVENYWHELAQRYRVRLPKRNAAASRRNQTRFLRQLGLTWGTAAEFLNEKPGEFFLMNPGWTTHMWAGIVLEQMAAAHSQGASS